MQSQKIKKESNIYTVSRSYNKVIEMDLAFHHAKTLCNKKQKAQKFYHQFFVLEIHFPLPISAHTRFMRTFCSSALL